MQIVDMETVRNFIAHLEKMQFIRIVILVGKRELMSLPSVNVYDENSLGLGCENLFNKQRERIFQGYRSVLPLGVGVIQ